jgi:hypothetical protein
MGALPPVSPLPSCQNVIFGGIIPYIAQNNFWEKNDLFWGIYNYEKDIKTNGIGFGEIG